MPRKFGSHTDMYERSEKGSEVCENLRFLVQEAWDEPYMPVAVNFCNSRSSKLIL